MGFVLLEEHQESLAREPSIPTLVRDSKLCVCLRACACACPCVLVMNFIAPVNDFCVHD